LGWESAPAPAPAVNRAACTAPSVRQTKAAEKTDGKGAEGDGTAVAESIRQKKSGDETLTETDLNGDKKPDVAVANKRGVCAYRVAGVGTLSFEVDADARAEEREACAAWHDERARLERQSGSVTGARAEEYAAAAIRARGDA
jgi:hypothetical protein